MDLCEEEFQYKWIEAAKICEQDLNVELKSTISIAKQWQRIGLCYTFASRQANNVEEFKKIRNLGIEAYKKAAKSYEKSTSVESKDKFNQSLGMAEYLRSWITINLEEKRKVLDNCCRFLKNSIQNFKGQQNKLCYATSANLLANCIYDQISMAQKGEEKLAKAQEGLEIAENLIRILSQSNYKSELVLAYMWGSIHSWYTANIEKKEVNRQRLAEKSLEYFYFLLKSTKF